MLYNSQHVQDKEAKRRAREEQLFRETYPALYAAEQRRKAKEARMAAKPVSSPKPQPEKTPVARPTTKPAAKMTKPTAKTTKPAAKTTKPAATTTKPAATTTKPAAKTTKPVVDLRKKAAAATTTTPAPVRSATPAPKAATPLEMAEARIQELTTKLAVAQRTIDEQNAAIARLQQAAEPNTPPTTTTLDDTTDSIPSNSIAPVPEIVADSAADQADTDAECTESKSPMAIMQQVIFEQAPSLHRLPQTGNFLHVPPLLWTSEVRVAAIDTLVRAITAIETGQLMAFEPYLVLAPTPCLAPVPLGQRDVALEYEETVLRALLARAHELGLL